MEEMTLEELKRQERLFEDSTELTEEPRLYYPTDEWVRELIKNIAEQKRNERG